MILETEYCYQIIMWIYRESNTVRGGEHRSIPNRDIHDELESKKKIHQNM